MPRPFPHPQPPAGFTLLELAIVLTVIGLIAGSIIVARDMIRNAEVQSVIDDEDRYKKAIQLFKEKYNYLPGDMPTATNFWGTDAGCPNTGYSAAEAVPKKATCNGDGNGRIDTFYEAMRAWQQLADAGFIEGAFSGIQSNAAADSLAIGTDVPASRVSTCGWMIGYIPAQGIGAVGIGTLNGGTYLALIGGGADQLYPPCLTPAESYGIDSKIDDGIPSSGYYVDGFIPFIAAFDTSSNGGWGWGTTSSTITNHADVWQCMPRGVLALYNTSASGIYCDPFFNTGI